jgi:hypothetical protein
MRMGSDGSSGGAWAVGLKGTTDKDLDVAFGLAAATAGRPDGAGVGLRLFLRLLELAVFAGDAAGLAGTRGAALTTLSPRQRDRVATKRFRFRAALAAGGAFVDAPIDRFPVDATDFAGTSAAAVATSLTAESVALEVISLQVTTFAAQNTRCAVAPGMAEPFAGVAATEAPATEDTHIQVKSSEYATHPSEAQDRVTFGGQEIAVGIEKAGAEETILPGTAAVAATSPPLLLPPLLPPPPPPHPSEAAALAPTKVQSVAVAAAPSHRGRSRERSMPRGDPSEAAAASAATQCAVLRDDAMLSAVDFTSRVEEDLKWHRGERCVCACN